MYYDNKTNAFQWSDNTTVNYTNFRSNDTSTGYCVIQERTYGWWDTHNCSNGSGDENGFVCKTRQYIRIKNKKFCLY